MSSDDKSSLLSFGLFELDTRSGELWRGGHHIKLSAQPFRVLSVLLAKPGEVVSREELQVKVWGENTNVDFERAVASAINKVREALSDSADNPRFIQTLPKRGYRFIAPVHAVIPQHTSVPAESRAAQAIAVPEPDWLLAGQDSRTSSAATLQVVELPTSATPEPVTGQKEVSPQPHATPRRLGVYALVLAVLLPAMLAVGALLGAWWRGRTEAAPLRVEQLTHNGAVSIGPPNLENLLTLATDGDRILTSVIQDGQPRLSSISIGTGDVQMLPLPKELAQGMLADVSRDGTRLLLKDRSSSASEQPLWIVPSAGGSAFRVGDILAHDAAWMPDGEGVVYANGNDLGIIRLDDGTSTPMAHLNGRAFWMRWSPDGKIMRFTLMNPVTHSSEIWEMHGKDGSPRRVSIPSAEYAGACCGSWTSDGSAYIFQSDSNLWQLRGSGKFETATQLTNGPLRFFSPATARTGNRVYFMGLDHPLGLQAFTAGQGFHAAPAFLSEATRVTYSRDAAWVAWTDNDEKLWRARADGSDKVRLTPAYLEAFLAHWSPDNKRLAVMAREPGKLWRIYLIDASGGAPEPLLTEDRNEADPDWSADGQHLVFGREADLMGKESGSHTLQILDLHTMKTETVPGSEGLFSPRWSPNGRWIVALSLDQKSVMLYDVANQHWRELIRTSAADPVWDADSRSIYIHAFQEPEQPILRVGITDGLPHVITDLSSLHDRGIVNYFFGGITPAEEPLIQPRIGTGDLYTLQLR